ncbi:MAG: hypothetical protein WAV59_07115 [Trichococcus flocculiformis]|jgi:hypothetical protein
MAKDIQKELNVKELKKSAEFNSKYDAVANEIQRLKARKEQAKEDIVTIKSALSHLVTDVEVLTDEKKRKEVLAKKAQLNEQLAEAELFAQMDIESYKQKKLDQLHDEGIEAMQEHKEFIDRADALLDEYQAEYEANKQLILAIRNASISNLALRRGAELRDKRRVKQIEEERKNAAPQQTVYVRLEDGTLVEKSQADKYKEESKKNFFRGTFS